MIQKLTQEAKRRPPEFLTAAILFLVWAAIFAVFVYRWRDILALPGMIGLANGCLAPHWIAYGGIVSFLAGHLLGYWRTGPAQAARGRDDQKVRRQERRQLRAEERANRRPFSTDSSKPLVFLDDAERTRLFWLYLTLTVFLFIAFMLLAYETFAVLNRGAYWPITSYVQCAGREAPWTSAVIVCAAGIALGNWFWYPEDPPIPPDPPR